MTSSPLFKKSCAHPRSHLDLVKHAGLSHRIVDHARRLKHSPALLAPDVAVRGSVCCLIVAVDHSGALSRCCEGCDAAKGMSESADLWGWAAMSWEKHWQQRIGVTLARGRAAVLLAAMRGGDSDNTLVDVNVARRSAETMEWSTDAGAGIQATAAAEMQGWA